jgi:uncharacterized membrane protein
MSEYWSLAVILFLSPITGVIKSLPFEFARNLSVCPLIFITAVLSSLVFFPIYFGVTNIIPKSEVLIRVSDKSHAKFTQYMGKWGYPGLAILVGIPGPGTGAIVVSSVASGLRLKLW